ncbi:hypothetical protein ACOMHN_014522 [Nucella lapillus]
MSCGKDNVTNDVDRPSLSEATSHDEGLKRAATMEHTTPATTSTTGLKRAATIEHTTPATTSTTGMKRSATMVHTTPATTSTAGMTTQMLAFGLTTHDGTREEDGGTTATNRKDVDGTTWTEFQ